MTRNDDFIGQLEGYLEEYEGSTPLPDDVRDAIRAELPSTHQRPAWWPARRFPEMNNMAKLGLAAAAVVVAALLGYNYLVAPNIGGPGSTIPSPEPTPHRRPTREDSAGADVGLEPGTHTSVSDDGFRQSPPVTVPAGWEGVRMAAVGKGGRPTSGSGHWPATDFATHVYRSVPVAGTLIEPPVGPTVDDLATALGRSGHAVMPSRRT